MNTKYIRKLATVAATAALTLQLFAGASSAAVPTGSSTGQSLGSVGGDGWAGFTTSLTYTDASTLSKLYLEIDITNGASIESFVATKNGSSVASSCDLSPTVIKCIFKTVRSVSNFDVTFAVDPAIADDVTASGNWSASGFVPGGNNSHGDAWPIGGKTSTGAPIDTLTAVYTLDEDYAAGFGNTSLTTQASTNKQSAKLTGLPSGKWASVDDNDGPDAFGFSVITLSVNGGAAEDFDLVITYPKNTQAPKSYIHFASAGYPDDEYFLCNKGESVDCFTWDKKSYVATLNLSHNGSVRRGS